MRTHRSRPRGKAAAIISALALTSLGALSACSSDDPTGTSKPPAETSSETDATSDTTTDATSEAGSLTIGSQQYYSNEIIAELYAQKLESIGYTIDRQYQIGQREIYLPEMAAKKIDILPEYSGNLLQYYDGDATAHSREEVLTALTGVLPEGLAILDAAEATDQDSLTVTKQWAEENNITSIEDLKKIDGPIKVAANSEFQTRPFGVPGLKEFYDVSVELFPVEDSGGPLTIKALLEGKVQVANIYTASPAIAENDLVVLEDPKDMILPQNVVPIISAKVDQKAADAINEVQAKLTSAELQKLNQISVSEQLDSAVIAENWLRAQGLISE